MKVARGTTVTTLHEVFINESIYMTSDYVATVLQSKRANFLLHSR